MISIGACRSNGRDCTIELWSCRQGVTVMDAALYFRTYWRDCAEVTDLFESLAAVAQPRGARHPQQRRAAAQNREAGAPASPRTWALLRWMRD